MSGWNFDQKSSKGDGNKKNFTKFPVGITNIRILDESPHERWIHWLQKYNRGLTCPGKGCPICEIRKKQKANKESYSYNMARRLTMNIYNHETEQVEIMEQGVTFFTDVKEMMLELKEEGKTLFDADLKVKRRGEGKDDTTYRIDLAKEYPLPESVMKKVEEEKVPDLSEFFGVPTLEQVQRLIDGDEWEDVFASGDDKDDEEQFEVE